MYDRTRFFLGANSQQGFISYFKQLQDTNDFGEVLILKGGPGSGKSSLMKRVAEYAAKKGHIIEEIPCASDPFSFDAIIDKTAGFAIMDGTSPHTQDPLIPGAYHHIMYTGDLWNSKKLNAHGEEIRFFSDLTSEYHNCAAAYIKAGSALLSENLRISKKYIKKQGIFDYVKNIVSKMPDGQSQKEDIRLLSSVSVGEIKYFDETISQMADKIYVIEDRWGGVSDTIIKTVKVLSQIKGIPIVYCPCACIAEKSDHIILPSQRVAFATENKFLKTEKGEKIKGEIFYDTGIDRTVMERRESDAEKLLLKAAAYVKTAKKTHDRLERFYVNAMDFSKMDKLFAEIIEKFYV